MLFYRVLLILILFSRVLMAGSFALVTSIPPLERWILKVVDPTQVKVSHLFESDESSHGLDIAPSLIKKIKDAQHLILMGTMDDNHLGSLTSDPKKVIKIFHTPFEEIQTSTGIYKADHFFISLDKEIYALQELRSLFQGKIPLNKNLDQTIKNLQKRLDELRKISKACKLNILSDHGGSLLFFKDLQLNILGYLETHSQMNLSLSKIETIRKNITPETLLVIESGSDPHIKEIRNRIRVDLFSQNIYSTLEEKIKDLCKKP